MIKNIVFDLGNVLISFRPAEYFERKQYPETIKNKILADIFGSREWHMLDNGDLSAGEAIDAIAARSSLRRDEIARIFDLRSDIMFPITDNVKLLPGLKKRGFRLYYLSNFPKDVFYEIKSGYFFFSHFDGGIISADVRYSKPDIRIYETLLKQYSLIPGETFFIDDIEANIRAAETVGIHGLITFGSADISASLKKALANGSA
jgi:FMN phosphatase YigB (HAD superfamily)